MGSLVKRTERIDMSYQQPPGYPPPGYGPPPPGYGPPPQKKGMSGAAIVLWILGGMFVLGGGSCVLCLAVGASAAGNGKGKPSSFGGPAAATPNETAVVVDIRTILAAYKGNELAGDNSYKDKLVQVTGGTVDDVKKDIFDHPFVTVGTGAQFEIPQVQCSLQTDQAGKAAGLQKGQKITIRGRVHGLMMNVQIHDCEIL
jgi:hypothetical protein